MTDENAEITYLVDENGEIIGEADEASDAETETPDAEPDEDLNEADEDDDEEAPGEAAPVESSAKSEKEIEKRKVSLQRENLRHVNRVQEIMQDDAADLIPCPVCVGDDLIQGWVYPPDVKEPTEEQVSRIRQFAGMPDYTNFKHVTWAQTCGTCGGFGKVVTGSKVSGREVTGCLDCNEAGWVNTRTHSAITNGDVPAEVPTVTGPTVFATAEPDERVAALRAEGYFVAPPLQVAQ